MARTKSLSFVFCMGVAVAGCSFASETLWPSLTGSDPAGKSQNQVAQIPASKAEKSGNPTLSPTAPPALGTTNFQPPAVTPGQATGTFVGQKITTMRGELQRMRSDLNGHNSSLQQLRSQTAEHSRVYHNTVAAIQARLQVGTTPGNPMLVQQWNRAQRELENLNGDVANMNSLANGVAGSASLSAYLLEATRATYGLSGAVDEDHKQLAVLEDEVNRTVVMIDRLLNELSEDIGRQNAYIGSERRNLTILSLAIKNGELYGANLANRAFSTSAPSASRAAPAAGPQLSGGGNRPLVVIRFDRPNVQYQQAVYSAVSQALERRPGAQFDVVAVAPSKGSAAQVSLATGKSKRNAQAVLRSLSDMGLPLDRVRLSALTSARADTNEVHIFVR